jgi:peptidoglycan/LPS O-acetylase OafA/YrhL
VPAPSKRQAPIHELTGLRFIAALWVVLYHFQDLIPYPPLLREVLSKGPAAVSLFFILSGFVLVYNYADWFWHDCARYRAFAWARLTRIYPMHLLALLLITPIALWLLAVQPSAPDISAGELVFSWLCNLLLVHASIPMASVLLVWNTPSWSISTEAFFYLVFPLFVRHVLARYTSLRDLVRLVLILYLAEGLALLIALNLLRAAPLLGLPDDPLLTSVWFYSPLLRVWEFLQGCVLGAIIPTLRRTSAGAAVAAAGPRGRNILLLLTLAGLLGILSLLAMLPQTLVIAHVGAYFILSPLLLVLIGLLASGPTLLTPLLTGRVSRLLGEASYSLYIIHWIPLSTLMALSAMGSAPTWWVALLVAGLTVLASVGLHRTVEQPLQRSLRAGVIWSRGAIASR